jgi:hypothetical protein
MFCYGLARPLWRIYFEHADRRDLNYIALKIRRTLRVDRISIFDSIARDRIDLSIGNASAEAAVLPGIQVDIAVLAHPLNLNHEIGIE